MNRSMMMWTASAIPMALSTAAALELTIDAPLMSHAVLQRDVPLKLSGTSSADTVKLTFGPHKRSAKVEEGRWSLSLPALKAAKGRPLTISAKDGEITLADVAVGDVVFCSGQSNMAWPVSRATGSPAAGIIADADIRLLRVDQAHSGAPRDVLPNNSAWGRATPETVQDFSAVCWYTAEKLVEGDVPLGLVQAAWGGSQIEAWLPSEKLAEIGLYDRQLEVLSVYSQSEAEAQRAFGDIWESSWSASTGNRPWEETRAVGKKVPGEPRDWKLYGHKDAENHFGYAWFFKELTLTEEEAASARSLNVGLVDDVDATWINGVFLGSTFSWSDERVYEIPQGLLKPGKNILTVNVVNSWGPGGLVGPASSMRIETDDGNAIPIDQGWRYQLVKQQGARAPQPPWSSVSGYSTIHNAMVAPLKNMKAAKAIWYQGESNSGRAGEYRALMDGLIGSWEDQFGEQLESVIVQLPDFGAASAVPRESGWAGIRAAQLSVATARENVGLAVTIDSGDVTDIHPANKKIVAERVVRAFKALASNSPQADGNAPLRAFRDGDVITVNLPEDSYQVLSGRRPNAVEACTEERSCFWADASLAGDQLTVSLEGVEAESIAAVRYCWADAPVCNLFVGDGTPVTPFEIEVSER